VVGISRQIAALPPSVPFLPDRYMLFRDRAFFAIQWWVGDHARDLGRTLGCGVASLEDGSLLMDHTIGKTISSVGDDLLVVPSLPDDALMCPVRALDAYVTVCKVNGVGVFKNFLFCTTSLPRHDWTVLLNGRHQMFAALPPSGSSFVCLHCPWRPCRGRLDAFGPLLLFRRCVLSLPLACVLPLHKAIKRS
jgi:hypothetical protein